MSYMEPKHIANLAQYPDRFDLYLNMQKIRIEHTRRYFEMAYSSRPVFDKSLLIDVNTHFKEHTGLDIPVSTIAEMFMMYPIEVSVVDGIYSTDARDALLDVISHYYLNSYWPVQMDSDAIDAVRWCNLLEVGFHVMNS